MRFNKVLLLFPDYKGSHFGALRPPAGLGYLARIMEVNDISYEVVDLAAAGGLYYLSRKLREFEPDLVAVSLMTYMYRRSYEIIKFVKQVCPSTFIAAGGPHVSTVRENVLADCSEIDFGVVLEGEYTFLELCQGREISKIRGLLYRDAGKVVYNGDRPFEENPDNFPFPVYNKFPLSKYITEEIGIVTSRGCPSSCIFCPVRAAIGKQYRARQPAKIVEEIAYWYEKGVRQFSILDDNFTLLKERAVEICEGIRGGGFNDIELNCNNGVRADRIDKELLLKMKEAGFKYIALGVEGGNDRILKNIKKGVSIEVIEKAIKIAVEMDFRVTLFFLVGSPGETLRDVQDSIDLARKYPVFDVRFYNLIPFPASELYSWVNENKYLLVSSEDYLNDSSQWDLNPVFSTPEFDLDERISALKTVRSVRKEIRYRSMKRELKSKMGLLAGPAARIFVQDWFQDRLMHSGVLRKNLKRLFVRATSR